MNVNPQLSTPAFEWKKAWSEDGHTLMIDERTLTMELWLDAPPRFSADGGKLLSSGDIIVAREGDFIVGGDWRHSDDMPIEKRHPDLIWIPYSLLNAADEELNPPSAPSANPYVDYGWVVRHLVHQQPGESRHLHCPVPEVSPSPSPSPSPVLWN